MTNSEYNWKNESDKILKRLVPQDEEEFLSKKRARDRCRFRRQSPGAGRRAGFR